MDSTLIIFNASGKNDNFFYNYSLKNNILSKGYLKGGRGPGEAIGAISTGITGNSLWLYDITLKKILTLNKEKVLRQDKSQSANEYPIKDDYYMINLKDSLTCLAVGNFHSKYKIQEIDLNSHKVLSEYGEFKNIPDNVPFDAYKSAHECFILTKPLGKKAVLFYRYTDVIEIFNTEKHTSLAIKGPAGIETDLDIMKLDNGNISIRNKNTRFTFLNGAVTDKFIYLLFSGNLHDSEYLDYGNYIYVYDWEGNPVKRLILDRSILSFTVTEDNKNMYAFDPNTGYVIQTKLIN